MPSRKSTEDLELAKLIYRTLFPGAQWSGLDPEGRRRFVRCARLIREIYLTPVPVNNTPSSPVRRAT